MTSSLVSQRIWPPPLSICSSGFGHPPPPSPLADMDPLTRNWTDLCGFGPPGTLSGSIFGLGGPILGGPNPPDHQNPNPGHIAGVGGGGG